MVLWVKRRVERLAAGRECNAMRPLLGGVCLFLVVAIQSAAAQLPKSALAVFGRVPFHNGSTIHMATLSPDGKYLGTLSSRSATVWNSSTGQPVHRFYFDIPNWPGYRRGIAFSPDSKRFVCGPDSENIYIWDIATGKEVRRFATEFEMFGNSFLRFSADGAAIIVESNGEVTWRNIETGKTMSRLLYGRLKQLSPDEKTFVLVRESTKQVVIGDVATGKIKHTLPIAASFREGLDELLFLPDRVTLAVVHRNFDAKLEAHNEVQFWNVVTGKRQERTWTLPKSNGLVSHNLALSQDGKVLYASGFFSSTVRRYDLVANKELSALPLQQTETVFSHPDGKTLFCVGSQEIHRFDLGTGKETTKDADFLDWRQSALSPDGHWLALHGMRYFNGFLELCDTRLSKSKRHAVKWGNEPRFVFPPDKRCLVLNFHPNLLFFSVPEFNEIKRIALPKEVDGTWASIAFSPDGQYAATRRDTGNLRVFAVKVEDVILAKDEIGQALFTPDSKRIVIAARNRSAIWLYDLATKKAVFEIKRPKDRGGFRRGTGALIADWAFSPDGRILALAMTGGHIVFLDAATGKERSRFLAMDTNGLFTRGDYFFHVTKVAFSPNGQWLAAGGEDGFLRIWDVATRRELHRLHGHERDTQTLGFSADGRRLVSFGSGEGFVWDLRPQAGKPSADRCADLVADDGPTVYRALWGLADDPKAPDLLRQKLPVQYLDTRPERIEELVSDLASPNFSVREAATRKLAALEENTRPVLLAELAKSPSLEVTRRIQRLLDALDNDAAPSSLRAARAVCAMELQDSDDAHKLLRDWAGGTPRLRLTDEARAAIKRLKANR